MVLVCWSGRSTWRDIRLGCERTPLRTHHSQFTSDSSETQVFRSQSIGRIQYYTGALSSSESVAQL